MWWTVVMAMQGAAGPPDTVRRAPRATAPSACPIDAGDDVVVCARDPETFRLKPLPEGFEAQQGPPTAALSIGGATLAAESEAGQAIGGAPPRAMVRLKFKF